MTFHETRALALAQAVIFSDKTMGLAGVLAAAAQFAAFIEDGSSAAVPAGTKPPKTEKVKAAPKVEEKAPAVEPEVNGPTIEEVKNKVNELLQANLRKGALDLFAKYDAKNASGLKASDYDAFIAAADDLLVAA
jgi:hypothetical protein